MAASCSVDGAWHARHDNGTLSAHELAGYWCTRNELLRTRLGDMTPHRAEWLCAYDAHERRRHRAALQFEWRTRDCGPAQLIAQLFEALRGRSILLVGDSLTLQHFVSLFCMLRRHVVVQHMWRFELSHGGAVEFAPSDYLVQRAPHGGFDRQLRLRKRDATIHLQFLGEPNPRFDRAWAARLRHDVLVLNTGGHWSPNDLAGYAAAAKAVMRHLRQYRGMVFYRTLQGVAGCGDLEDVPPGAADGWTAFPAFDAVWHSLAPRHGLRILNVSTSTRADGHCERCYRASRHVRDCLHGCLPGPVDAWAMVLGGALTAAFRQTVA